MTRRLTLWEPRPGPVREPGEVVPAQDRTPTPGPCVAVVPAAEPAAPQARSLAAAFVEALRARGAPAPLHVAVREAPGTEAALEVAEPSTAGRAEVWQLRGDPMQRSQSVALLERRWDVGRWLVVEGAALPATRRPRLCVIVHHGVSPVTRDAVAGLLLPDADLVVWRWGAALVHTLAERLVPER